jgi:hypothetical protein
LLPSLTPDGDHDKAIAELDDLVSVPGSERELAALARLVASALRGFPWSDEAEGVVIDLDANVPIALKSVALTREGQFDDAEALLAPFGGEAWAAELRVKNAAGRGDMKRAAELAAEDLEHRAPAYDTRLLYASTFADTGDISRARAELRSLSRDSRAPDDVRRKAFQGLVWLAEGDVSLAFDLLQEWKQAFPDDPEIQLEFDRLDRLLREA